MGLLDGVLPAVYSAGNKLKRQVGGLLSDPVGTVQQQIGLLNDKAGAFNQLHSQATQEAVSAARTGAGIGPAQQKIAGTLADAYNPMGMVVWHGSPHKFTKFDSSKIGTGEGAQAYGHGLYLAESPDVAKGYQASTTKGFGLPDGQDVQGVANIIALRGEDAARKAYANLGGRLDDVISQAKQAIDNGSSLYKVDLPDDAIAKMLDWDKPLSQQAPEVKDAINRVGRSPEYYGLERVADDMRMVEMQKLFQSRDGVEALRQHGIPGIRYLDGGSRGAGSGTSNFVVFPGNEGLLSILERNGQPIK